MQARLDARIQIDRRSDFVKSYLSWLPAIGSDLQALLGFWTPSSRHSLHLVDMRIISNLASRNPDRLKHTKLIISSKSTVSTLTITRSINAHTAMSSARYLLQGRRFQYQAELFTAPHHGAEYFPGFNIVARR